MGACPSAFCSWMSTGSVPALKASAPIADFPRKKEHHFSERSGFHGKTSGWRGRQPGSDPICRVLKPGGMLMSVRTARIWGRCGIRGLSCCTGKIRQPSGSSITCKPYGGERYLPCMTAGNTTMKPSCAGNPPNPFFPNHAYCTMQNALEAKAFRHYVRCSGAPNGT